MSFGPNPWQQTSWDWRAAGNFMCGGAGAGFLIAWALLPKPGAMTGPGLSWSLLVGLGLIGLGLLCVWLEIGRPLRALHVFFNPRTSWMSREAFVALFLFPTGLLAMLGLNGWIGPMAVLAVAFLYCQSRMLQAARGIPAWRSRLLPSLIFVTGLCEGCGGLIFLGLFYGQVTNLLMLAFTATVLARFAIWTLYRTSVNASLAARACVALDRAGRWLLLAGVLAPLALLGIGAGLATGAIQSLLVAAAGACASCAGAYLKYTLVTRASFNQGFALKKIPVRGVRGNS